MKQNRVHTMFLRIFLLAALILSGFGNTAMAATTWSVVTIQGNTITGSSPANIATSALVGDGITVNGITGGTITATSLPSTITVTFTGGQVLTYNINIGATTHVPLPAWALVAMGATFLGIAFRRRSNKLAMAAA